MRSAGDAEHAPACLAFVRAASAFFAVLAACCITPSAAAPIALKDDLGRNVELAAPARRIVTLAPFLAELAFSAGAGNRIVGVSEHSDYPAEARALPQVASAAGVSLEQVVVLRPELVLAWRDTVRPADLERLQGFGIPVFVARARSILDVGRLYGVIEKLTGTRSPKPLDAFHEKLRKVLRKPDRVYRLERTGSQVVFRVLSPEIDLKLSPDEKKKGPAGQPKGPKK